MLRTSLLIAVVFFVGLSYDVYAQDDGQRSRELAAALDKTKYKKKEKANISVEIYIDIKNELALRNAVDYSGNYEGEDGEYRLTLNVDGSGTASGNGYDILAGRRMGFTLKDASVNGALLTATKVYENGEQQKFEGVFVNRTIATGRSANEIGSRETRFGLGFIQDAGRVDSPKGTQNWTSRVFLERR